MGLEIGENGCFGERVKKKKTYMGLSEVTLGLEGSLGNGFAHYNKDMHVQDEKDVVVDIK